MSKSSAFSFGKTKSLFTRSFYITWSNKIGACCLLSSAYITNSDASVNFEIQKTWLFKTSVEKSKGMGASLLHGACSTADLQSGHGIFDLFFFWKILWYLLGRSKLVNRSGCFRQTIGIANGSFFSLLTNHQSNCVLQAIKCICGTLGLP